MWEYSRRLLLIQHFLIKTIGSLSLRRFCIDFVSYEYYKYKFLKKKVGPLGCTNNMFTYGNMKNQSIGLEKKLLSLSSITSSNQII